MLCLPLSCGLVSEVSRGVCWVRRLKSDSHRVFGKCARSIKPTLSNKSMSNQAKTKPKQEAKPRKTYLFRLYPTHKQINTLLEWLRLVCPLFNAALHKRKKDNPMAGGSPPSAPHISHGPCVQHLPPR